MDRVYESGASATPPTPPAVPSNGYPSRGNPSTGAMPTVPGPYMMHQLVEEIMAVIAAGNIVPNKLVLNQLKLALDAVYLKKTGTAPILQNFSGLTRSLTPLGGAQVREYVDIPNAATVGGIEICQVYNCAINPATGVWSGRDIADICWLEKWHDVAGTKEIWFAPAAAANAVPAWAQICAINITTGSMTVAGTVSAAQATAAAHLVTKSQMDAALALKRNNASNSVSGIGDANTLVTDGVYDGNFNNAPDMNRCYIEVIRYSLYAVGSNEFVLQRFTGMNGPKAGKTYVRTKNSAGVWSNWRENSLVIPGEIITFAGATPPDGYLACPTAPTNISRANYPDLFAAIGTAWGNGDGATTFGMPWFPADYALLQANANVGTQSAGAVMAHTHTVPTWNGAIGSPGVNLQGQAAVNTTTTTSSTGGSANLAAGSRVLMCVKY